MTSPNHSSPQADHAAAHGEFRSQEPIVLDETTPRALRIQLAHARRALFWSAAGIIFGVGFLLGGSFPRPNLEDANSDLGMAPGFVLILGCAYLGTGIWRKRANLRTALQARELEADLANFGEHVIGVESLPELEIVGLLCRLAEAHNRGDRRAGLLGLRVVQFKWIRPEAREFIRYALAADPAGLLALSRQDARIPALAAQGDLKSAWDRARLRRSHRDWDGPTGEILA